MPAAARGPVRLVRASVVAATSVALALVAHVLGGGSVPPTVVLGALTAVVLAAAVPFSGRRGGSLGATALLGLGQLGLHHGLDALGGMGCAPATEMMGHAHAVRLACTAALSQPAPPHLAGTGRSSMVVLHLVATLVTALLIAGTDRALAWITTWLRPLVALLTAVAVPAFALLPVRVETSGGVGRCDLGPVPPRGPPRSSAHVALAA